MLIYDREKIFRSGTKFKTGFGAGVAADLADITYDGLCAPNEKKIFRTEIYLKDENVSEIIES